VYPEGEVSGNCADPLGIKPHCEEAGQKAARDAHLGTHKGKPTHTQKGPDFTFTA
jgi:hypothetical protein